MFAKRCEDQTIALVRGLEYSVSPEQVSLVKKLLSGAVKMATSWNMPDKAAEQFGKVAEGVVDVASLALAEKDRVEQLIKKH